MQMNKYIVFQHYLCINKEMTILVTSLFFLASSYVVNIYCYINIIENTNILVYNYDR